MPSGAVRFSDLFTYHISVLVKLTDRATARVYAERTGLNLSEARAITIIGAEQPIGVQKLAGFGSLDKSQASRVAESLGARGFVEKVRDPNDARATALSLTRRGRQLNATLLKIASARNADILAPLRDAERKVLLSLMQRLVAHAESAARPERCINPEEKSK